MIVRSSLPSTLGWGADFALAWADVMTRTAPTSARESRLLEIASDVHEHAAARPSAGRRISRQVALRSVRGIPADLSWRLRLELSAGRRLWHVDHPASLLAASLTVLVPLNLATGAPHVGGWWSLDVALSWMVILFAAVTVVRHVQRRVQGRLRGWNDLRLGPLTRARRAAVGVVGLSWACATVGNVPGSMLSGFSSLSWGVFGFALAGYVLLVVASACAALLGVRSDHAGTLPRR